MNHDSECGCVECSEAHDYRKEQEARAEANEAALPENVEFVEAAELKVNRGFRKGFRNPSRSQARVKRAAKRFTSKARRRAFKGLRVSVSQTANSFYW